MATIILGSYMLRYPLGGMASWVMQYLVGFQDLGHDVYFVEKAGYRNACYDPSRDVMGDDCTYGTATVNALLSRFRMDRRWCFVDVADRYYGLSRSRVKALFRSADLFVDMGTHGAWLKEAADTRIRVLVDGEPGFAQMKMENRLADGETLHQYDYYYTAGANVGTAQSTAPTAGRAWRPLYHPVVLRLFPPKPAPSGAPFTTVMNWRSHPPLDFHGKTYGQKDVEFEKFLELPSRVSGQLELAVSGKNVPGDRLQRAGWRLRDAHAVTRSYDSFREYIRASKGEFSVCKHVFVATNTGWFSDRSAAYLASGHPVVLQDTGFSRHLPCGRGLFAVGSLEDAAAAINEIHRDYDRHAQWARRIAVEYLDASKLLGRFLGDLGIS